MSTIGVSIAIPEPWATRLQNYRTSIGDESATKIPTHITLVPPLEAEDMDAVESHLSAVAERTSRFEIHLRGTGTFRPVSPVVFVGVVRGISECEQLANVARSGPLGQELDFPYHPHVTIAHHLPSEALDRAFSELADFECQFEASEFHLYVHDEQVGWRISRSFALAGEPSGVPAPDVPATPNSEG
ncbi:2'-5' RNA ligase [Nocardioides daedukensis]|uniref:2'-5' RNA ligase n=1 Tax=Nocardioides daedukensis TaxID=634462 RepID=A0A7Y9S3A1_9ACTN|nr:2'-5' RNA ligase [Nocardioides daedukensis]